jgi:hypothetical protein
MNSLIRNNDFFRKLTEEGLIEKMKYKLTEEDIGPTKHESPAHKKYDALNTGLYLWALQQIKPKCQAALNEYATYMSGCELGSIIPHKTRSHCYRSHLCMEPVTPQKFDPTKKIEFDHEFPKMRTCRLQTLIESEEMLEELSTEYAEALVRALADRIHLCATPTDFEVSVEFDRMWIDVRRYISWSEEEALKNDGDGAMCTFSPKVEIKAKTLPICYSSIEECMVVGREKAKPVAKLVYVRERNPSCGCSRKALRRESNRPLRHPWLFITAWNQYQQCLEVLSNDLYDFDCNSYY